MIDIRYLKTVGDYGVGPLPLPKEKKPRCCAYRIKSRWSESMQWNPSDRWYAFSTRFLPVLEDPYRWFKPSSASFRINWRSSSFEAENIFFVLSLWNSISTVQFSINFKVLVMIDGCWRNASKSCAGGQNISFLPARSFGSCLLRMIFLSMARSKRWTL